MFAIDATELLSAPLSLSSAVAVLDLNNYTDEIREESKDLWVTTLQRSHGDVGSNRSSFSSWAEDYVMWQRLAWDDEKARLVQLE